MCRRCWKSSYAERGSARLRSLPAPQSGDRDPVSWSQSSSLNPAGRVMQLLQPQAQGANAVRSSQNVLCPDQPQVGPKPSPGFWLMAQFSLVSPQLCPFRSAGCSALVVHNPGQSPGLISGAGSTPVPAPCPSPAPAQTGYSCSPQTPEPETPISPWPST